MVTETQSVTWQKFHVDVNGSMRWNSSNHCHVMKYASKRLFFAFKDFVPGMRDFPGKVGIYRTLREAKAACEAIS